ncbi:MAG: Rrf2 family transcriptional regulator [SAR324 cluster bacterium]|nr:Rrf2 family transcriptional regulator [SAR324 cluster bacterium]
MRLKKQTDYALRVLMYLTINQESSATVKEIADSFEISQNHLMKVVQNLKHLGYLHTVRGNKGGIWLGKPPGEIIIGQALRDLGEENELAECFIQASNCRITAQCKLKHAFKKANDAFFAVLDDVSLADIQGNPAALTQLLNIPESSFARG